MANTPKIERIEFTLFEISVENMTTQLDLASPMHRAVTTRRSAWACEFSLIPELSASTCQVAAARG